MRCASMQPAASCYMVSQRSATLGMKGRVTISHAFCLGQLEPARLERMIELLLEQDIAVMTHAPSGGTPFPPVRLLAERGVRLCTGSDGVRDCWTPLNTGDMLERAYLIAYLKRLSRRCGAGAGAAHGDLRRRAVDACAGLRLVGRLHRRSVIVPGESAAEAVATHPRPRWVLKAGRVVAFDN